MWDYTLAISRLSNGIEKAEVREMLQTHKELWRKIEEMEKKYDQ